VMGTGGVQVPPDGYFEEIQKVLDRHDVLMIADEVICGFGRLGAWFGADVFGIRPDLMTCAKGLTSAYLPMSACLVSERIWDVIIDHASMMGVFGHGFTYSAHPVAAAAAMANLDIVEREDLVGRAKTVGAKFQARMRDAFAGHPLVGDIRGMGLIMGIELVADKAIKAGFELKHKVPARIARACLDEGLILRGLPGGNTMAFSPPLVISEDEVEEIVTRFTRALDKAGKSFKDDGIWH